MDSNIKLVLKYLKDKDCIESFLTLERETSVSLVTYSKEIQFFKKIMLKGDFQEAINFLITFENRIEQSHYKKIILEILRQKLCELIDNPNEDQLKNLFEKQLITYCSEEEFQQLFNYLTFRSVNQIQGLQKWSVIRGRFQCFENIIPYLDMFNSTVKHDQPEEKLQDIIDFYQRSKNSQREPFSFNRNGNQIQSMKESSFQKNKSAFPHNKIIEREELPQQRASILNENNEKQKEIIKNSIMNMNISGNYSQMRNKLSTNNPSTIIKKKNSLDQEIKPQKNILSNEKSQVFTEKNPSLQQKSQFIQKNNHSNNQKSQILQKSQPNLDGIKTSSIQKNHINASGVDKNNTVIDKSSVFSDKRPRINASLNGPMNRQRLEGSVKVDNFMKNESSVSVQTDNIPNSYKNMKLEKSQMINNSNNLSHIGKSNKPQIKSNYLKNQDNPVIYSHLNQLQSSQLNQIAQEDNSQTVHSVKNVRQKYSYLGGKHQDEQLQQEVKKNIQYLEQTSSVIYKNKEQLQQQNFTFSSQQEQPFKIKNITKLASTNDSKAIRTCQFSNSGNFFAVGTNSSILKVFDVKNLFVKNKFQQMLPIYQIEGVHSKSIFCLDWASNERHIVTCSNDLNIKLTEIGKHFTDHKTNVIGRHDSCIRMARYSPSQTKIVSCGDDSLIKVWDIGKVKKCLNLKSHTCSVSAFKMQNQNQLYSVSKDMTLKKWDLRIGENVATSKQQESELTYIANNTDKIVVSHKNGTVSFFSPSLQLMHAVQIHQQEIRSVQSLKGEEMFLTASFDGYVGLFNESNSHQPNYFQHNDNGEDKVVFATFLHSSHYHGFSSTSTQGLCHIYSYE